MRVLGFLISILLHGCSNGGSDSAAPPLPWAVSVDTTVSGEPLNTALLGHYDLSGALYDFATVPGLITTMAVAGFSEWRISAGRWEQATQLLPMLTDGFTVCPAESGIFADPLIYTGDVDLVAERDWFTDTSITPDTNADSSYALGYLRSVIDAAELFGTKPFVSIDYMPSPLSINQVFSRNDCSTSFMNAVSNHRPIDNAVFASAVQGLVQRVVEGTGSKIGNERPRAVNYWEVWNEPEFPFFWEPGFTADPTIFFDMATVALLALDAYRTTSANASLKFGLASFANSDNAIGTITGYDPAAIPMDFISFHAYYDDPLVILDKIAAVASTAQNSTNYQNIELALAEWGPDLASRAGDQTYAASIAPPLHAATVMAWVQPPVWTGHTVRSSMIFIRVLL